MLPLSSSRPRQHLAPAPAPGTPMAPPLPSPSPDPRLPAPGSRLETQRARSGGGAATLLCENSTLGRTCSACTAAHTPGGTPQQHRSRGDGQRNSFLHACTPTAVPHLTQSMPFANSRTSRGCLSLSSLPPAPSSNPTCHSFLLGALPFHCKQSLVSARRQHSQFFLAVATFFSAAPAAAVLDTPQSAEVIQTAALPQVPHAS